MTTSYSGQLYAMLELLKPIMWSVYNDSDLLGRDRELRAKVMQHIDKAFDSMSVAADTLSGAGR